MQLSHEGSVVLQESDVEEEEGDDDDNLDEEVEEDLDVEVMEVDVDDMLGGDNGGGGFVEMPEKCRNCCRKKNAMVEDTEPYCLELALYECTGIRTRLKFCYFTQRDVQDEDEIVLCSECASFLVHGGKQDMKNAWPAFMWYVLRNDVIACHCGIGVWSYIPMKWRHWWIDDFVMLHAVDGGISMDVPKPIFDEIMEM